jgi:hypothetical protein
MRYQIYLVLFYKIYPEQFYVYNNYIFTLNPLNAELNPIRHLLALAGAHHFVHVGRVWVNEVLITTVRAVVNWQNAPACKLKNSSVA